MKVHLHPLVYIVSNNQLVGSNHYKKFLLWLGEMDVDITRVRLYNINDRPFDGIMSKLSLIQAIKLDQIKIINLGEQAESYLKEVGIEGYLTFPSLDESINPEFIVGKDYIYGKEEETKTESSSEAPAEQSGNG